MIYKTGLLPSPEPPRLRFRSYLLPQVIPPVPATFGHKGLYPNRGWGMLKNGGSGAIGDCTVAGAMHAVMLWRKLVNNPVRFSDIDAQEDYFAITGGEDTGADMVSVAKYWQTTGFRDIRANRHHILAYMQVDETRLDHIDAACYFFDVVGLGVQIGQKEMEQFTYRRPWDDPNSPVDGYHYVPMVYKDPDYRTVITWGGEQPITEAWFKAKVNEVVAVMSNENLIAGKSLEGFDVDALEADLEGLAA